MMNPPRDQPKKTSFLVGKFRISCLEMRNVIRILALILIWPPDSSTDEAANEAQLTCRRNLKISLQSIFREYENNNTICVSRILSFNQLLLRTFRCFVDY